MSAQKPTKYTDIMKPEDISIGHCWTIFAAAIGLDGHSDVQRFEMRKAFYAGFSEGFKVLNDVSTACTEAQAVEVLTRLDLECREFVGKMLAERPPR